MVRLVDLSGYVEQGQPVYPGMQGTQFFVTKTHEEDGYSWKQRVGETDAVNRKLKAKDTGDPSDHPTVRSLLVGEHGPTHVDAFTHFDPTQDGSIDRIPLERFYGDAVGVDVTDVPSDEFITTESIQGSLDEGGLELRDSDAITLYTGHREENYAVNDLEKRYAYLHDYTGLSEDAARWLANNGVRNIGLDAPSIDHSQAVDTKEYPAHDVCAEFEILNMEHMANLWAVAGTRYTHLCLSPSNSATGRGHRSGQ